jgi:hypothetical protein
MGHVMTRLISTLLLILFAIPVLAQSQAPVDSFLVADWHFDEPNGYTLIDSAAYDNHGYAAGTTVVPGVKGPGRSFNGTLDYISVNAPRLLDFAPSQSFRIDLSFKTDTSSGIILRKGLAPLPGYMIAVRDGLLQGTIGNRVDSSYPDTLLSITSLQRVDDNTWHRASFIRDRQLHKLFLLIDGTEAAPPVDDNVGFALSNSQPVTIGRWGNIQFPDYFRGQLDEIRIVRFFPVLSDTQSVWHFDETSRAVAFDASVYHDTAEVIGTTVVPGIRGNARSFNGNGDCMWIPDVESGALDFGVSTSFTVEAWFKTSSINSQIIVEKGVITQPGFSLQMEAGKIIVILGNTIVGTPPDGQLVIRGTHLYNDNTWHCASFVRDRAVKKLFLYVDGLLDAPAIDDSFPYAIASDRPMTIGRWEEIPYYWTGLIDEVALYRGARHPAAALLPRLSLSTDLVDFGKIRVGDSATAVVQVTNMGLHDTLQISAMHVQAPFSCVPDAPLALAPRSSLTLLVKYKPSGAGADTASLLLATNDPNQLTAAIHLQGTGAGMTAAPAIIAIADVPDDQGHKVRVVWLRSIYDGLDNSQSAVGYDVWRRVEESAQGGPSTGGTVPPASTILSLQSVLWDFIGTIPPVGFDEYSYVAPTLYDSTVLNGMHRSVFMITVRTSAEQIYFSEPDSGYSADNLAPHQPGNLIGSTSEGVYLQWDPPADPDILLYEVYRGTQMSFIPSQGNKIGTTRSNSYADPHAPGGTVFYCVAAVDSAGNRSMYSQKVGLFVTGVNPGGDQVPRQFSLYQSYPNPFNPSTQIRYDVPSRSHVLIRVFDMLGRQVAALVDEEKGAGQYTVVWDARDAATGMYWYRMEAGTFSSVQKMLLLK